jgi:hypothetical protein
MPHLNVNPADLLRVADDYTELQARAAAIGPRAVEEVQRIIASHGPMGYPVAVGIVTNLARKQAALDAKAADFGRYGQRFTEHANAYVSEDREAAQRYDAPTDLLDTDLASYGPAPLPTGRVICSEGLGGFACSEFLPGGMVFHWLSPVDLTGQWPDFP